MISSAAAAVCQAVRSTGDLLLTICESQPSRAQRSLPLDGVHGYSKTDARSVAVRTCVLRHTSSCRLTDFSAGNGDIGESRQVLAPPPPSLMTNLTAGESYTTILIDCASTSLQEFTVSKAAL